MREVLGNLTNEEKKMRLDSYKLKVAGSLTRGWSVTGQSREDHLKEVMAIGLEIEKQLRELGISLNRRMQ